MQTLIPKSRLSAAVADAREIARQAKEAVEAKMSADGIQVPSNSIEFERGWKRVKGSKDKYLEYLAAIPLNRRVPHPSPRVSRLGNLETYK